MENWFLQNWVYLPSIFSILIWVYTLQKSILIERRKTNWEEKEKKYIKTFQYTFILVLVFKILMALLLTSAQYLIWKSDKFTSLLLSIKLTRIEGTLLNYLPNILEQSGGYFVFYSFFRFWLEPLIGFIIAYVFFVFLETLRKYNERFLGKSDSLLALWQCALLGWPSFIIYLGSFVIVFLGYSLWRRWKKTIYTPITLPLWVSSGIALFLGNYLLQILGLGFLTLFRT